MKQELTPNIGPRYTGAMLVYINCKSVARVLQELGNFKTSSDPDKDRLVKKVPVIIS